MAGSHVGPRTLSGPPDINPDKRNTRELEKEGKMKEFKLLHSISALQQKLTKWKIKLRSENGLYFIFNFQHQLTRVTLSISTSSVPKNKAALAN